MGLKKKQTVGYKYYFDIQGGLGRGPVDEIVEIRADNKTAWAGSVTDNADIVIDQPGLFGGNDKEGGIVGTLKIFMGSVTQLIDPTVAEALGGIVPAFRGALTFFYSGQISSNSPYPKPWKVRLRRSLKGWHNDTPWYPEKAMVPLAAGAIRAQNGAHIIYECLTNPLWGRGLSPAMINDVTFRATADALFAEGFGLCIRWNRQEDIDEFIKLVVNHIGGALYIDRLTGLFTLKLIRDDYDAAALPVYDYDSGLLEVLEDSTSTVDSSLNEFILQYKDPITDEVKSVRAQNLAGRQSAGAVISDTRLYEGLPVYELGAKVAQRELRFQSAGVRAMKLRFDRSAWKQHPGSVLAIRIPDRGINHMVMRVGSYSETGSAGNREITLEVVQDIFRMDDNAFTVEQPSLWVPSDPNPYPVEVRDIGELNYRDLFLNLPTAELAAVDELSGTVGILAQRPTTMSPNYDVKTMAAGETEFTYQMTADWCPNAILTNSAGAADTTISLAFAYGMRLALSPAIKIGDEILKVVSMDTTIGEAIVERGCVDTLPAAHVAGERIWFIDDYIAAAPVEYAAGEEISVKLITNSKGGALPDTAATIDVVEIVARQGKPYPPAKAKVNGSYFYSLPGTVTGADLTFTWEHRNRLTQKDFLVGYTEDSVTPEAGQTYTLEIRDSVTNALIRPAYTGIAGTTFDYSVDDALADGFRASLKAVLKSVRGGIECMFPVTFNINRQEEGALFRTSKYYERYAVAPSTAERKAVYNFVDSLFDLNLWTRIKYFHLLMARSSQGSLIDLINPIASRDMVPTNAPTFTTKLGWNGDDATSFLIKSGVNYNALGVLQNDAHMLAYLSGGVKGSMATFGVTQNPASGPRFYIQPHRVGDTYSGAMHAASGTFSGPTGDLVVEGLVGVNRVDAANVSYFKNGTVSAAVAHASTGLPVGNVTVGKATSGATVVYSSQRVGMIAGGLGLTSTQIADYDNAWDAFLAEWASV